MVADSGPVRKDSTEVRRRVGRYELLTPIGKGGMAEVHLAMQRGPAGFEKLVVIKLVHDHLATQKEFVDMLLDEGRLAGMIKHPNVVDIYDVGEDNGRYFVAMEYLDGEPLLGILRVGAEGTRLDPLSTARVIADTAEGLEAAHRLKSRDGKPLGLIHHDVSLGNIVVLYNGQVKLVDFGVAKAREKDKREAIQGKFAYMAPEKLTQGDVDRRSDIWSLGVVAWEALTLSRLFKGSDDPETMKQVLELEIQPPSKACRDVPAELDRVIMRALERDPNKRYSTAKGLALDLEEVLRKRGYAGKNDRIAGYMETTFAKQIAVRERLVADLSAGRTSKEVIAAFREAASRSVSTTGGRPLVEPGDLPAEAPASDPVPVRPDATGAKRDSIGELQGWLDDERRRRGQPLWLRYLPFAAGGVVVLILIIALASRGGGSSTAETPVVDAARIAIVDAAVVAPPVADAAPAAIDAATGIVDASDIEVPVTPVDTPHTRPQDKPQTKPQDRPKPQDKPQAKPPDKPPTATPNNVDGLYKLGMDQLRRGDNNGAIASFNQATKLSPSYAPAWYGLGRAYEAAGMRRGPIKAAYLRYLSLAPNGPNAGDARARVDKM